MSRKLTTFVTLLDENGDRHTFGPDDEVPDEFAERIVNPDVWADEPTKPEPKTSTKAAAKDDDEDDEHKGKSTRRSS